MKNKKIFKTILLIAIILLAVGCGLASCKKTHAYDMIFVSDGLDSPNAYQGVIIGYSLDLGDLQGHQINASIGDNFQDIMAIYRQYYEDCCTYMFLDFSPNNDTCILLVNFYYTLENGNPTETNMEILSFAEDTLQWQIRHTYGYLASYDRLVLFYWSPFRTYCSYQQVQVNQMAAETTPIRFTALGSAQQVPIYSENYESASYDEEQNPEDMFFRYMRSNTHSNEVIYLSNVQPGLNFPTILDMYNYALTYRYNYFNNFRITGFRGGYDLGYSEGASANETQAFNDGKAVGYQLGLQDGYDQGMRGDNAVSSFINILTSIFTGIGAIFSIELFPHITIGLFLLVPLFFGVLGLILWIWRHN